MQISDSIREVKKAAPDVVEILAYVGIGAIVVGVIGGLSSTLTLPATMVAFLNVTLGTNAVTVLTTVLTVLGTIVSLLVVAALWYFIKGKSKSGKSM